MSTLPLFASCAAVLIGLGLYALITDPVPLRKILAFNLLGSGVFLTFGVISRRAAAAGFEGDPVPQAMTITAIVVAFAATAMAIALVSRLVEAGGRATMGSVSSENAGTDGGNS
jgi:multicomponent Na+:H+ antiporter subunit C